MTTFNNNDTVRFHHDESNTELTGTIVRVYRTKARVRIDDTEEVVSVGLDELHKAGDRAPMAAMLSKYRPGYQPSVAASGRKSLNNGDDLASVLEYKTHTEVLAAAEKALDFETGSLAKAYQHLNPGQQRMCGGNRLRAAIKRGDLTIEDVKKAF